MFAEFEMQDPHRFHPAIRFLMPALVVLAGCTPPSSSKTALNDRTANELMETWNQAQLDRDWDTWFLCMTPEAREQQKNSLLFLYSVLRSDSDSTTDSSDANEDKSGIARDEKTRRLIRTAEQNEDFLLDFKKHIDSISDPNAANAEGVDRSFKFLEKNGHSARAKVFKNGRSTGTVYLEKVDGHWRVVATLGAP